MNVLSVVEYKIPLDPEDANWLDCYLDKRHPNNTSWFDSKYQLRDDNFKWSVMLDEERDAILREKKTREMEDQLIEWYKKYK